MSDFAVRLANLGKRYRLYRSPSDKVFDALGLGGVLGVKRRTQDFTNMLIDLAVWDLKHLNAIIAELRAKRVISRVERVTG